MSAYPDTLLGDVAEFIMGQAPPGAECNFDGQGTIFVKAGEFRERFPVVREWTTRPLKLARSGDVLVCVVGATAGKVNLAIDCAIGRSVAAVRPDPSKLDSSYLYRFLAR
jgi:type I restriction enzyme S subunit